MKNPFLILASIVLLLISYSCYKTEAVLEEEQSKQEQQARKGQANMRSSGIDEATYLQLPDDDKKNFWINRIQDLMSDPAINSQQSVFLSQTVNELQTINGFYLSPTLASLGNELVNSFSETDFLTIFTTVDGFVFSGNNTPNCSYCSVATGGNPTAAATSLPDCNCRWSCGGSESGPSSCVNSPGQQNCCREVFSLCGFLGLQRCNGHDTLF